MERALADPASANPIVSGHEVEEGGEVGWITSPHDRRVVVGVCRSAGPEAIDKALAAAQGGKRGLGPAWAARRVPRCSIAPPISSRQIGLR